MKIIFIIPPFDLMKQGYGSKQSIRAGFFPPLGVGYLAAPLLQSGHSVKIIDAPPLGWGNEEIGQALAEFKPDIIGVSSLTASAKEAYSLVNFLKEQAPTRPVVFGGAHASCFPEAIFEACPSLDGLIFGEGEVTFKKIVASMAQAGRISVDILGTWWRQDGRLIKNQPAEPVLNLDDLLPPAYELYDLALYRPLPLQYKKLPVANVITSRGCPWGRCTFCFEAGRASQQYRRHSPGRAAQEIKDLVEKFGIKEIAFWDDNFLVNEKWIFEFCDLLDTSGLRLPWSAYGRVNTITQPMLERVKRSGCWSVFYGFETGNEDLLVRIKKGITLEQSRQAARWTRDLGMDIRGSFMLALPGETPAKAHQTVEFAKELNLPFVQFLLTYPEWGTELYDDALAHGQIFNEYKSRTTATYVPAGYQDAVQVRQIQKMAYRSYYFRPAFFWMHFKRLIKSPAIAKQYFEGLKFIFGISA